MQPATAWMIYEYQQHMREARGPNVKTIDARLRHIHQDAPVFPSAPKARLGFRPAHADHFWKAADPVRKIIRDIHQRKSAPADDDLHDLVDQLPAGKRDIVVQVTKGLLES